MLGHPQRIEEEARADKNGGDCPSLPLSVTAVTEKKSKHGSKA